MKKVWNLYPGPSILPHEVLVRAQAEMLEFGGYGMSPMEVSHRTKSFDDIIYGSEALLRELLGIPDNYKVLYMPGGGTAQFSCIPLNLMRNKKADYIDTGIWPELAYNEAVRYLDAKYIASSADGGYNYIPKVTPDMVRPDADYVYICGNNTDHGTAFNETNFPDVGDKPLVTDMTSIIGSQEIDVAKYGLIFAGAQKNLGCTGLTIVIIRDDLIQEAEKFVPMMYRYKQFADNQSMYNTPPTYSVYIHYLLLQWFKEKGGLSKMIEDTKKKSGMIYDFVDHSELWNCPVQREDRSPTNVCYNGKTPELEELFLEEAKKEGFEGIKGFGRYKRADQRSVGIRMSFYNAFPMEGAEAFLDFMKRFEEKYS